MTLLAVLLGSFEPSIFCSTGLDERFIAAVAQRDNAAEARPLLRQYATDYAARWQSNPRPEFAQMRGRCEYLAGNLPGAVAAFRAGMQQFPADAELQRDLAIVRSEVVSPSAMPLQRPFEWRSRVGPWTAFGVALAAVVLVTAGVVRHVTVRARWALPAAAAGLVLLGVVVLWHWRCEREAARDAEFPPLVVRTETVLRAGNGVTYPPRIAGLLPPGLEVRETARRGTWVRVELETGETGWVEEVALLRVE